ncbi:MAG TPA: TIM-barrel domain-containing protein [Caulobacterales bacterium]|nr:TIM-barrel domain-containing protein [Caulobacterales bacterium]
MGIDVKAKAAKWSGGLAAALSALLMLNACAASGSGTAPSIAASAVAPSSHGVTITPTAHPERRVRLTVMSDRIVRVTEFPTSDLTLPESLMVTAQPTGQFEMSTAGDVLTLTTAHVRAEANLSTGVVRFLDAQGQPILAEAGAGQFTPVTVEGQNFYAIRQQFNRGTDEGFYGLGQHQNRQFNYNGEDVELAQHNMDIGIPFLVSSRNYGVLWDTNSITRFGDARPYQAITQSLTVRDAQGAEGGLTAQYYGANNALVVTRREADVDYQYLPTNQFATGQAVRDVWPAEMNHVEPAKIVWTGTLEARSAGVHKFRLYAGNYFKLWIDNQLVLDGWRQNWNAWYRNFDLQMAPGERHAIRIEWIPNGSFIKLDHLDPLPADERHSLSLASEVSHAIDYYFVSGDNADQVIAGYRELTGKAVLLPRWAYGYWQSRQRYNTQAELTGVVHEYRRRGLPLDAIVQDWFYWPEDAWGSHDFDRARYPDPGAMVREVHANNAHIMISVWPKFYPSTDNYKELDAIGGIYRRNVEMGRRDWVGPGYVSTYYDPYATRVQDVYWRQIHEKLGVLGFDAWWLDNDEPDIHSNLSIPDRAYIQGPTARGPGAEYFNSFPLMHVGGMYEHQHANDPDTRQYIFSRSAWGGMQRYAATMWSGDLAARWYDLRAQISAGINFSMSGIPNWTFDIGGFAVEDRYSHHDPAHVEEWREQYLRWFQFGAFVPIFRAHGELPLREIYNIAPDGSDVQRSLIWYDRLRYRLMPYIYTVAANTYHGDGTIMRGLVMDFPDDPNVRNMGEEYMFGPAFLVAPVYEFHARMRDVYLPAGNRWYDFYTGRSFEGGQHINADAPLARMPLFVRAGSIVPIGPAIQYTNQNPGGPITLYVYTGRDGSFDLYEDDGVSYGYQRGAFSRIPIRYDEATGTLTIGARSGAFPGMVTNRTFNVRFISGENRNAVNFDARGDRSVRYNGAAVAVRRGA